MSKDKSITNTNQLGDFMSDNDKQKHDYYERATITPRAYHGSDLYFESLKNRDYFMKFSEIIYSKYFELAYKLGGFEIYCVPYDLTTPVSLERQDYLTKTNAWYFQDGEPDLYDTPISQNKLDAMIKKAKKNPKLKEELDGIASLCRVKILQAEEAEGLACALEVALKKLSPGLILEDIDLGEWHAASRFWEREISSHNSSMERRFCANRQISIVKHEDGTEGAIDASYFFPTDTGSTESAISPKNTFSDFVSRPHIMEFISLLRRGAVRIIK